MLVFLGAVSFISGVGCFAAGMGTATLAHLVLGALGG